MVNYCEGVCPVEMNFSRALMFNRFFSGAGCVFDFDVTFIFTFGR